MFLSTGIPQMTMITKIDEACPETEKNLRNVYKSKYVKKKVSKFESVKKCDERAQNLNMTWCFFNTQMEEFSAAVGIPMNCIFPVKNYSNEIDMNEDVDTLILSALRKMIDFGDDFIEKQIR